MKSDLTKIEADKIREGFAYFTTDLEQRGYAYAADQGLLRTAEEIPSTWCLRQIGAAVVLDELIACGILKSIWPLCRFTRDYLELVAKSTANYLYAPLPEMQDANVGRFALNVIWFRLRHENWWAPNGKNSERMAGSLLNGISLTEEAMDQLAQLIWTKRTLKVTEQ